jgi:hypothetical protein
MFTPSPDRELFIVMLIVPVEFALEIQYISILHWLCEQQALAN